MTWSLERAEDHLLSLELFGMSFGLERIHALLRVLGDPQKRLRAIHVVGTNGKSSTVRYAAALLTANGLRAGAYLSPHLTSFAERVLIDGTEVSGEAFGAAVKRAAEAAEEVEGVTQFELLTAAALDELARREVDAAVIEAGLGGRFDATNVLDAPVVALTNVGLEHTRWLGDTIAEIAAEKLAVVRPGATLVLGSRQPEVEALASETGATVVHSTPVDTPLRGYQRANYRTAHEAAQRLTGGRILHSSIHVNVPGRLQTIGERPLTIVDGAHNPAGMAALVASLPDRPFVAVVSILEDKDAAGMLQALLGKCSAVVFCASRNPRALPPDTLVPLAGDVPSEVVDDPRAALERARELAGPDGAVLATGSIYLVADLVGDPARRRASAL